MIPPQELKNKSFTKVMRGYSSIEVDDHIDFIVGKYTEMYRENDEMERKLKTMQAKLDEYRSEEESIRSALINAQRASSKIISEANERADVIMRSAKTNCDRIVAEFHEQIKSEYEKLRTLRSSVAEFKASLFEQYHTHIEYIESISPESIDEKIQELDADYYTKQVVDNIKSDISAGKVQSLYQEPAASADSNTDLPETPSTEPAYNQAESDTHTANDGLYNGTLSKDEPFDETPVEDEPFDETPIEDDPFDETPVNDADEDNTGKEASAIYDDDNTREYILPKLNNQQKFVEAAHVDPEPEPEPELPVKKWQPKQKQAQYQSELEPEPEHKVPEYKSSGVKDTIQALNKQFVDNDGGNNRNDYVYGNSSSRLGANSQDSSLDSEADSEYQEFIRNIAASSADKRNANAGQTQYSQPSQPSQKFRISKAPQDSSRRRPLTSTQEFDLVYNDPNKGQNNKNNKRR